MLKFKTWNDFKLFLQEYYTASCFNCIGYKEHDEEFNGRFICFKTLSPVRCDLLWICTEWESPDGLLPKDVEDEPVNQLSDEVVEYLNNIDKRASFEEIRGIINGYEENLE